MRLSEHHHAISNELDLYGIRPEIEVTHGNHIRFRWRAGGHAQSLVTACTPSDHRATKNELAKVRRLLRDAGVKKDKAPPAVAAPVEVIAAAEVPAAPEAPSIDDRLANIEADLRRLLDLVTAMQPKPQPQQQPAAPLKINGEQPHASSLFAPRRMRHNSMQRADFWIWKGMRFDVFRGIAAIAKDVGKAKQAVATTLTKLKALGLVHHDRAKGWRKAAKVDRLPSNIINGRIIERPAVAHERMDRL